MWIISIGIFLNLMVVSCILGAFYYKNYILLIECNKIEIHEAINKYDTILCFRLKISSSWSLNISKYKSEVIFEICFFRLTTLVDNGVQK